MRFLYGKIKARKGNTIRVNFSSPTRILFLTESEFNKYKNNMSFTYFGGHKDESPYDFVTPKATTWFVVVEKGGTYHEPGDITATFGLVTAPKQIESSNASEENHSEEVEVENDAEDSENSEEELEEKED